MTSGVITLKTKGDLYFEEKGATNLNCNFETVSTYKYFYTLVCVLMNTDEDQDLVVFKLAYYNENHNIVRIGARRVKQIIGGFLPIPNTLYFSYSRNLISVVASAYYTIQQQQQTNYKILFFDVNTLTMLGSIKLECANLNIEQMIGSEFYWSKGMDDDESNNVFLMFNFPGQNIFQGDQKYLCMNNKKI